MCLYYDVLSVLCVLNLFGHFQIGVVIHYFLHITLIKAHRLAFVAALHCGSNLAVYNEI